MMADEDLGCDLSQQYCSFLKYSARKRPLNGRLWYGGMGPSCVSLLYIPLSHQHPLDIRLLGTGLAQSPILQTP